MLDRDAHQMNLNCRAIASVEHRIFADERPQMLVQAGLTITSCVRVFCIRASAGARHAVRLALESGALGELR